MITRKDLMVAAILTFCLTATLFMIIPTESSPAAGEYDPWVDINEDGEINIMDIASVAKSYGASGNPERTVQIMHSTFEDGIEDIYIDPGEGWQYPEVYEIWLLGFREVTICFYTNVTLSATVYWFPTFEIGNTTIVTISAIAAYGQFDMFQIQPYIFQKTYPVSMPVFLVKVFNNASTTARVHFWTYATT